MSREESLVCVATSFFNKARSALYENVNIKAETKGLLQNFLSLQTLNVQPFSSHIVEYGIRYMPLFISESITNAMFQIGRKLILFAERKADERL